MIYLIELVMGRFAGERFWVKKDRKKDSMAIAKAFGVLPMATFRSIRKNGLRGIFWHNEYIKIIKRKKEGKNEG